MGTLINNITKIDPTFNMRLEDRLIKYAPRLKEAEKEIIRWLLTDKTIDQITYEKNLKEILAAVAAVPDLILESVDINIDDDTEGETICVDQWAKEDIIKDRFGYMALLQKKLSTK